VNKSIVAILDKGRGIVENISRNGGFLKTDTEVGGTFGIELRMTGSRTLKMECEPLWRNPAGVGFRVLNTEPAKKGRYERYVESQLKSLERFGHSRVFTTDILVTLKDTNMFGNVYFSNYIEYQGVIREKFLLYTVPDLHRLLAGNRIRLVTVDTYNRYVSNAFFGDTLVAGLTTSDINAASCRLNISFRNKATGDLVSRGYQRFCVVSDQGKVLRLPRELLDPLDFFQETET
jgi:enediyne biosynthesis thioesterase